MQRSIDRLRGPKQARNQWLAPTLTRLQAGSAEFQQTNGTDNFTTAS